MQIIIGRVMLTLQFHLSPKQCSAIDTLKFVQIFAMPEDNSDKLYKIRPLIQDLNRNFQLLRLPNAAQSVDESMVLFKDRSSLKQYNPMKPTKRSYKIWCRADMSGYVYELELYQGK